MTRQVVAVEGVMLSSTQMLAPGAIVLDPERSREKLPVTFAFQSEKLPIGWASEFERDPATGVCTMEIELNPGVEKLGPYGWLLSGTRVKEIRDLRLISHGVLREIAMIPGLEETEEAEAKIGQYWLAKELAEKAPEIDTSDVDHRTLLSKYMEMVDSAEGTFFVHDAYRASRAEIWPGSEDFTEAEWYELNKIANREL